MMMALAKSMKKAPTMGTTRKARGAGPYRSASDSMLAMALAVVPSMNPQKPGAGDRRVVILSEEPEQGPEARGPDNDDLRGDDRQHGQGDARQLPELERHHGHGDEEGEGTRCRYRLSIAATGRCSPVKSARLRMMAPANMAPM